MGLGEHDVNILREYIQFFPESGLSKALSAYLESELSPFPIPVEVDEDGNPVAKEPAAEEDSPDELIDAMIVKLPGDFFQSPSILTLFVGRTRKISQLNPLPSNCG